MWAGTWREGRSRLAQRDNRGRRKPFGHPRQPRRGTHQGPWGNGYVKKSSTAVGRRSAHTRARAPGVDLKVSRAAEKLAHLISNGSFNNIPLPPLPSTPSLSVFSPSHSFSLFPSISLFLYVSLPFSFSTSLFLSLTLTPSVALGVDYVRALTVLYFRDALSRFPPGQRGPEIKMFRGSFRRRLPGVLLPAP